MRVSTRIDSRDSQFFIELFANPNKFSKCAGQCGNPEIYMHCPKANSVQFIYINNNYIFTTRQNMQHMITYMYMDSQIYVEINKNLCQFSKCAGHYEKSDLYMHCTG